MIWLTRIGLLLFLAVALGSVAQAEDRLTKYKNNEVIACVIKKAELDGVEVEITEAKTQAKAKLTLAPAEIAEIEWDINDTEWRAGIAAFSSASYGQAVQHFQSILGDKEEYDKFRAVAKPALCYYCAESLYRSGKQSEAMPMFERLMTEFKTSFYVPRAVGSLVDAAIQTKAFDKVPPLLNQLRGMGGEQKALADYYEGQMLLAQEKVKPAEDKFAAAAGNSNVPATKGMALMGQAQCAIAQNQVPRARDLAQKALTAGVTASVAGAAHLTIGDALLSEIETQKPVGDALITKLLDALLEYMRVTEQYPNDPRTEPQAMLKAGECLQRLSKLPNRGADRHRALSMYTRLTTHPVYRNSRWAAQAAEALKKL